VSERDVTVMKTGTWLYDGQVEKPVRIIRQTWDYHYEEGYDDEPPCLNDEGYAFYAVYGEPWPPEPGREEWGSRWFSRSHGCLSLEEAVALAERTITSPIVWGRVPEIEDPEDYFRTLLRQSIWPLGRPRTESAEEMLECWAAFVEQCKGGYGAYGDVMEAYDNDLSIRDAIAVVVEDAALQRMAGFRWFFDRVAATDERFKALLQKDVAIKGEDSPWWRRGVLIYAAKDYAATIKRLYGIEVEVLNP
jgi:hypothetical protein